MARTGRHYGAANAMTVRQEQGRRYQAEWDAQQAAWAAGMLGTIPGAWEKRIARQHAERTAGGPDALRAGNLWLIDTTERLQSIRIPLNASDADLCDMARQKASECMSLAAVAVDMASMRAALEQFVAGYGIDPPGPTIEDRPAVRRMTAPLWWRLKLRRAQTRAIEAAAQALGYVHRHGEMYASNVTTERRRQQKRRNAANLDATTARNLDTGQSFTLAELAARSVANPAIRRGELMTRMRGFEEVAQGVGDVAEFWTATAPSRMHRKTITKAGQVIDNAKHDGTTPREAQQYLARTWAKFRAFIHRRGVRIYGFRVAEPHHDGTPHWHLIVFFRPMLDAGRALAPRLRAWFRRYFLADSKGETGARANRCDFKRIDHERGSPAGYIAAYVSKNIDGGGYQVQGDIEGGAHDAYTPSHRVEAWATAWGIRQFQQVGGPPVGVWRELRRTDETHSDAIEPARRAADNGNWRDYCAAMGMRKAVLRAELIATQSNRWAKPSKHGVTRPLPSRVTWRVRYHWPIELAKTRAGTRWNHAAGCDEPACLTAYGEEAPPAVYGVKEMGRQVGRRRPETAWPSRRYAWEIRRRPMADQSADAVGPGALARSAPWTCVNNCTGDKDRANAIGRGIVEENIRQLRGSGFHEAADAAERVLDGTDGARRVNSGSGRESKQVAGLVHVAGACAENRYRPRGPGRRHGRGD